MNKLSNKKYILGNKAETLKSLQGNLTTAIVKPVLIFSVRDWVFDSKSILDEVKTFYINKTVIIRSAASVEDSEDSSYAGHFKSVPNINSSNKCEIEAAICQVIDSYRGIAGNHNFFIQEQVLNIDMCGVLLTRDLDSLAPYYIVNYDESKNHDAITSGKDGNIKTYIRAHSSPEKAKTKKLAQVIELAQELINIFNNDALDIEFAFDSKNKLYLLQVRQIVTKNKSQIENSNKHGNFLNKIVKKINKINDSHPNLCGEKGILSIMSDWNPAEMIGIRPRRLALSLYKELITDSIWAYQRDNYGYRNLRSFPLLISLIEQPYIDVRVSFNSFIPKNLSKNIASKLVDYYTDCLLSKPTEHDKIEFNIVFSCYYFGINKKLEELTGKGFNDLEVDRIKFSLLDLTNSITSPKQGLYKDDFKKIDQLVERCDEVLNSKLSLIDKIYWLSENCKRFGTLPFAGLARAGFIAVQFLNSMVSENIISEDEKELFFANMNSVGKELSIDTSKLNKGLLSKEDFLSIYGHLRPGTYDILSKRYDESFDDYFSNRLESKASKEVKGLDAKFTFSDEQLSNIQEHLELNGLNIAADEFLDFIKVAIEGREYGKFVFTKIVSEILKLVEELGAKFDYTREDMSWVDINTILNMYSNLTTEDVSEILIDNINRNKSYHQVSQQIRLPQVISSESDIYDFFMNDVEPNFITNNRITETLILESDLLNSNLSKKIVFIKQADPGFDWLFSKNIGGLVTMYGGANSHMAIRCSELKIPAIIGCGEKNFDEWSKSKILEIDCANKSIKIIE